MSAPAGPYTVVHRQRPNADCSCGEHVISRWAYATLEEVVAFVRRLAGANWNGVIEASVVRVGETGSATGVRAIRLPDGSEIVVEATTWRRLASDVGRLPVHRFDEWRSAVLAAWNAEYGIHGQEGQHD